MSKSEMPTPLQSDQLYRAVWRWHFYAGVFVIPFLLTLSLSGMLMLISKPLEALFQQALSSVEVKGEVLPASSLLAIVREQYPHAAIKLYLPTQTVTDTARFSLQAHGANNHSGHSAASTTVFLNPYNGDILGEQDPSNTLYARLQSFHSSLYLGNIGEGLIETAAGLAILMVISGLYLAWPRDWRPALAPKFLLIKREHWTREHWKSLHRLLGFSVAIPLLFFLISGMAWTNVWGGKLVQAWSSLPGTRFEAPLDTSLEVPVEEHTHQSMNQHGLHQVPWAVAQTPMPKSFDGSAELTLDTVTTIAEAQGFTNYRVHLPQNKTDVWTVSATTIAGDLTNPLEERILHLDRSNGKILANITFADYPAMGKAMAAFIPLHQGDLGLWNWLLNLAFVAMVVVMIVSGITLWWKRRPTNSRKLSPPVTTPKINHVVVAAMLIISLCFPLSAAALTFIIVVDWLLVSRIEPLRMALK